MAFFVLFGAWKDWHPSAEAVVVGVLLVISRTVRILRPGPVVMVSSSSSSSSSSCGQICRLAVSPDCPVLGGEILLVFPLPALVPPEMV